MAPSPGSKAGDDGSYEGESVDLGFIDDAAAAEDLNKEPVDPVGDGRGDAGFAGALPAARS